MTEQEIAKELTLKAMDKLDLRTFSRTQPEQTEFVAQEVGKLYQEIFKAVIDANDHLNR